MVPDKQIEITVLLPHGETSQIRVDPSTPVMDVLIRVASTNHLTPSDHVIEPVANQESTSCIKPAFPSTKIGSLGTTVIKLVTKRSQLSQYRQIQRSNRQARKTPEVKLRVRVFLPRGQLHVLRVSHDLPIWQIHQQLCRDKSLDPLKYHLVHPADENEVLSPCRTLHDYNLQEVSLMERDNYTHPTDGLFKKKECSSSVSSDSLCGALSLHSDESPEGSVSWSSCRPSSVPPSTDFREQKNCERRQGQQRKRPAPPIPGLAPEKSAPNACVVLNEETCSTSSSSNDNTLRAESAPLHCSASNEQVFGETRRDTQTSAPLRKRSQSKKRLAPQPPRQRETILVD